MSSFRADKKIIAPRRPANTLAGVMIAAALISLVLVAQAPPPDAFTRDVEPFLAKHCASCHRASALGGEKVKGDFELPFFKGAAAAAKEPALWEKVAKKLRAAEMPPKARPRPSDAEVSAVLSWIDAGVFGSGGAADPGRVTLRRLNAYEYNYTTRDLLGVDLKLGDSFPGDEVGYGFDNIGDVLSLPPILMERYLEAAEKLAEQAIVAAPKKGAALPESHKRILFCEPGKGLTRRECARRIVERFATCAYRRPATADEVGRLLKLFDLAEKNKETFERGIQLACQAVLASPHFLYRVELDTARGDSAEVRPLNGWQLASRLSYFLWSSMPDDELSELARQGKLREAEVLEAQVRRMIASPKSRGLLKTFSALWLGSRKMKTVTPDTDRFPAFSEDLRQAMRTETEMFFEEVLEKDLSILTFLDADFTFLNETLAKHYGVKGVKGREFRRVELKDRRRGGVLTQGTVLTVTSNPTRTSPVKRGRWILEQILGAPPPPPPPGQDVLKEEDSVSGALSLRRKMERHRKDPNCAVCHDRMDQLGFALENFDAVGAWRELDGDVAVDASGTLPDGRAVAGVEGLKRVLLEDKRAFARSLAEKMLTFALGRGIEYKDHGAVDRIARRVEESDYRMSVLILEIVRSEPFQLRKGEGLPP
jgi:mono/diheme cytochrome c family protein